VDGWFDTWLTLEVWLAMYACERNSMKKYFLFRHIIHIFSMVHWWVLMVHPDIQSSEKVSLTQPAKRAQLEFI
jgi:hypothetical protein